MVAAEVVDGSVLNQFGSVILRPAVGVDDGHSFAWKTLEDSGLDGRDDWSNRLGVVMSGQTNDDIDLAYVDELAKKFIRQKIFFGQFNLPNRAFRDWILVLL